MMSLSQRDVRDKSVREALGRALKNDGRLSHDEVVDIVCSTFDHGVITRQEKEGLRVILHKSGTILPRSRMLLQNLLASMSTAMVMERPKFTISQKAGKLVCDFLKRKGRGLFPHLDRDEIGVGLLMRLHNPGLIRQGSSSLCGPASLLYNVASDHPREFVQFGIDLYERGRGRIGNLIVEPGSDCRNYNPAKAIPPVDWMMAASVRDSENWFLDYESVKNEVAGITLPGKLVDWFKAAGYRDVRNETNLIFTKGGDTITEVNRLSGLGYRVCLFIGDQMLYATKQTQASTTPGHWVVLRSPIKRSSSGVSAKVFTWGNGDFEIPKGSDLSETDFLKNFYGFVAAKP